MMAIRIGLLDAFREATDPPTFVGGVDDMRVAVPLLEALGHEMRLTVGTTAGQHRWLVSQGPEYLAMREDGGVGSFLVVTATGVDIAVGDRGGIERRFTYTSLAEAWEAFQAWAPDRMSEPFGWIREAMSGRRRPDGDESKEYVRP